MIGAKRVLQLECCTLHEVISTRTQRNTFHIFPDGRNVMLPGTSIDIWSKLYISSGIQCTSTFTRSQNPAHLCQLTESYVVFSVWQTKTIKISSPLSLRCDISWQALLSFGALVGGTIRCGTIIHPPLPLRWGLPGHSESSIFSNTMSITLSCT